MRSEEGPTDPWIDIHKARVGTTFAKWAAVLFGVLMFGVTAGRLGQLYEGKVKDLESRQSDMPTKADLTQQRVEYEKIMRKLLEEASWWCPPQVRKGPAVWVECRVSFETYPAPPKAR